MIHLAIVVNGEFVNHDVKTKNYNNSELSLLIANLELLKKDFLSMIEYEYEIEGDDDV